MTHRKELYWKLAGQYMGYPQCCINDFCRNTTRMQATERQKIAGNETGFIPCPECAELVLSGKRTLQSLISNRVDPRPFPECDYEHFLTFINGLCA